MLLFKAIILNNAKYRVFVEQADKFLDYNLNIF